MIGKIGVYKYNDNTFPFRREVCSLLGTERLEELHRSFPSGEWREKITELRELSESKFDRSWPTLNEFIRTEIEPRCGRLVARQDHATFRFHFAYAANSHPLQSLMLREHEYEALVTRFYSPSRSRAFHRDGDHNVSQRAINLWIPLTELCPANTLWIGGRDAEAADARPFETAVGNYLLFDAVTRWHGPILNSSEITRVSFDIRLVFDPETSLTRSLRLSPSVS